MHFRIRCAGLVQSLGEEPIPESAPESRPSKLRDCAPQSRDIFKSILAWNLSQRPLLENAKMAHESSGKRLTIISSAYPGKMFHSVCPSVLGRSSRLLPFDVSVSPSHVSLNAIFPSLCSFVFALSQSQGHTNSQEWGKTPRQTQMSM